MCMRAPHERGVADKARCMLGVFLYGYVRCCTIACVCACCVVCFGVAQSESTLVCQNRSCIVVMIICSRDWPHVLVLLRTTAVHLALPESFKSVSRRFRESMIVYMTTLSVRPKDDSLG